MQIDFSGEISGIGAPSGQTCAITIGQRLAEPDQHQLLQSTQSTLYMPICVDLTTEGLDMVAEGCSVPK